MWFAHRFPIINVTSSGNTFQDDNKKQIVEEDYIREVIKPEFEEVNLYPEGALMKEINR